MLNENDVVEAVCRHLIASGYQILKRCSTSDQGIDIIAKHPSEAGRLLIEAKGGTSAREGSARYDKGFNRSQVFDRVAKCFYTVACMSTLEGGESDRVAMAFPNTEMFQNYLGRIGSVVRRLNVSIFLVNHDISVSMF